MILSSRKRLTDFSAFAGISRRSTDDGFADRRRSSSRCR